MIKELLMSNDYKAMIIHSAIGLINNKTEFSPRRDIKIEESKWPKLERLFINQRIREVN